MINIQIHEVVGAEWEKPGDQPDAPRRLLIRTTSGVQEITLFLAQPKATPKDGEKLIA